MMLMFQLQSSCSSREVMDAYAADLPAVLVAESGAFIRWAPECLWESQVDATLTEGPAAEGAWDGLGSADAAMQEQAQRRPAWMKQVRQSTSVYEIILIPFLIRAKKHCAAASVWLR